MWNLNAHITTKFSIPIQSNRVCDCQGGYDSMHPVGIGRKPC